MRRYRGALGVAALLLAAVLVLVPAPASSAAGLLVAQTDATPAPDNLSAWRNQPGVVLKLMVVGSTSGSVWGDGIYTDDSHLATAAVHAGVLKAGDKGVVTVRILGPQSSFSGASRNGISSGDYGPWSGSFGFVVETGALPDPGSLTGFAGRTGDTLSFLVTGAASGSVWGDGIYTTDSRLARAAVHAGVLAVGESGEVAVEILGPQASFAASNRNGVSTSSWGPYDSSFRFGGARQEVLPDPGSLSGFANRTGAVLAFEVTGAAFGSVWGDRIYTTDSRLARAAVHAGLVRVGETATVSVEILGPQNGFASSERNGVSTSSWGSYGSSFHFLGAVADGN